MRDGATVALIAAVVALVAGCATPGGDAPRYDATSTPQAQAAVFIKAPTRATNLGQVGSLAITSCNVMFAQETAGNSSTSTGIAEEMRNRHKGSTTVGASVSQTYTLSGLNDEVMQQMTDAICANARDKLAAAGYTIVARETLAKDALYQRVLASGKPSPHEWTNSEQQVRGRYRVFARSGDPIFDDRYLGMGGGFLSGLKSIGGNDAKSMQALLADSAGISLVDINLMVDFASMKAAGNNGRFSSFTGQSRAQVEAEAALSVSGDLGVIVNADLKCYKAVSGERACAPPVASQIASAQPVLIADPFYTRITDVTSAGAKATDTVVSAAAILGGLAGIGGLSTMSRSSYQVDVVPEQFRAAAEKAADGFLDMAVTRMRQAG